MAKCSNYYGVWLGIMSSAVEEIINLIDVRININKELIPKVKSQEKIKKKAKIE